MKVIKGYKGFDKDLKCKGFQYEIGKTYTTKEEIALCSSGFHFCQDFKDVNDFYNFNLDNTRFCEVKATGKTLSEEGKTVTNKLVIGREIARQEMYETLNEGKNNTGFFNTGNSNTGDSNTGNSNTGDSNTGDWNTGNRNTGDRNTGDSNTGNSNTGYSNTGYRNTGYRNTGDRNTGNSNTGDSNTGNRNTGDRNTGNSNTGDSNTGYRNTGDRNTGDWNTGYRNTGDRNTGDSNTGYRNTGDRNTGDWNTGDWNKTDRSAGVFCNKQLNLILFNKKTSMTFDEWRNTRAYSILCRVEVNKWIYFEDMSSEEKTNNESAETCGGYLKIIPTAESSKTWWNDISDNDKQEIFNLPNFSLVVFNDIMELKITRKEYNQVIKNANN